MNKTRSEVSNSILNDSQGTVAVEFAIIAPILFAVILGTIDLGRYAWTLSTIQMAADEAVRQGAVQNKNVTEVREMAENNLLAMDNANFTVTPTNATINGTNMLQVRIQHTYRFMFPLSVVRSTAAMEVTSRFPKP